MRWIPLLLLACAAIGAEAAGVRHAAAQGPPTRFFGRVTVNGERPPAGTAVEAYVNGTLCGEGTVRELGDPIGIGYVVDALPDSFKPGCGKDGDEVTFKVGGLDAGQRGEFRSGSFPQVDLSVSGQLATPPPTPSPLPILSPGPSGQAPIVSPAPVESPAPGASPAASPAPGTSPSPGASPGAESSPSPGASASPSASPEGSASPSPSGSASPGASPSAASSPSAGPITARGDTDGDEDDGMSPAVWALPLIVVLAGAGAGLYVYQRRRRGA